LNKFGTDIHKNVTVNMTVVQYNFTAFTRTICDNTMYDKPRVAYVSNTGLIGSVVSRQPRLVTDERNGCTDQAGH